MQRASYSTSPKTGLPPHPLLPDALQRIARREIYVSSVREADDEHSGDHAAASLPMLQTSIAHCSCCLASHPIPSCLVLCSLVKSRLLTYNWSAHDHDSDRAAARAPTLATVSSQLQAAG